MASPTPAINITFPPISAADSDDALVARLTDIVNAAFSTETDIFVDGYRRIEQDGIREIVRAGELAIAYLEGTTDAIGCVRIAPVEEDPKVWEIGMLSADPAFRGGGVGRALFLFAEDHCRRSGMTETQLSLLVPMWIENGHPFKNRLHEWYTRLGYKVVRVGTLEEYHHALAKLLRGRCDFKIYRKPL
ncbi:hypothetical protein C8F01DRAFT_649254 [Mycena amicta]|nr:hypothetical protein C8F01DRAFT_649254 [Mycena amicta]